MKFYVQVQRDGCDQWCRVNSWCNKNAAVGDAQHTYLNKDNPCSRGVTAARVVHGKRKPVVVFQAVAS